MDDECGTDLATPCRVRDLAPQDRPREKLQRLGVAALGDNELLALVLGHGSGQENALDIANRVLTQAGGVHGLARAYDSQLLRVTGVGPAMAGRIVAAVELGRRSLAVPDVRAQLNGPREVARYLLPRFGARAVEQFGVVLLDTRHRVLRTVVLSVGTIDASVVHPRDVFRVAASAGASVIVLFHNHPSGDPTPSEDDVLLTARLVDAGQLMGIEVLDHLVLADASYFSFRQEGRL